MKRVRSIAVMLVLVSLFACGSPEEYQKQKIAADTTSAGLSIGIGLKKEHALWAQAFVRKVSQTRLIWESGKSSLAVQMTDSLVNVIEHALDTIPPRDDRADFLTIVLTDLQQQAMTWQGIRGDTADVRARSVRFEALNEHFRRQRDSLDKTP